MGDLNRFLVAKLAYDRLPEGVLAGEVMGIGSFCCCFGL